MTIEFIGKSVLITVDGERVLVVSDLHLGYGESLRESGVFVPERINGEIMRDFGEIFKRVGKIDKIIILGDVKHEIGLILEDERREMGVLFELFDKFCDKIIVVRGNHDALLGIILRKDIELVDYYIWGEFAFLHGNKDYVQIHDKKVKTWLIGHIHPAVNLQDGVKEEKYKCFLDGRFRGKRVIVLPSFFSGVEGTDVREGGQETAWKFNFDKFNVRVIGENLEVLDFGLLKNL